MYSEMGLLHTVAVVHTFIYHIPGQVGHTVCDSLHFHSPKLKQLLCKTFFLNYSICIPQLANWLYFYLQAFIQKVYIFTIKP